MAGGERHYITHGPYGGDCSCGRIFRVSTKFGADALKGHNLAHANANRHADAANKKLGLEVR
jgi:predicted NBD/HSP70 family sugar kinase